MQRSRYILMGSLFLLSATAMPATAPAAASPESTQGLNLDWLDRSVSPAENFYQFANGSWQENNPIPAAYSRWGVFNILHVRNQKIVREIIENAAAADAEPGTITQKVGDFYASGMDVEAINKAGVKPLAAEFARIRGISNREELQATIAHLQMIGVNALFRFGSMQDFEDSSQVIGAAFQGGLGLPDRDYYLNTAQACEEEKAASEDPSSEQAKTAYAACLKQAENFEQTRDAYVAHIAAMLELLGDSEKEASAQAKTIMAIETRLAKASMPRIKMRDPHAIYNMKSLEELSTIAPNLSWQDYFAHMGVAELTQINLATPDFFKALNDELKDVSLADWKSYLRWHLIDTFAPYLSEAFVKENFKMQSALSGAEELRPRWQRVVNAENSALGFAVGKLYVKQEFPASSKKAVLDILANIRTALKSDLKTLEWMSPETRKAARKKLSLMGERIGYPDEWRSYENLTITSGPYVENVMAAQVFSNKRDINKIGKPVDKSDWYMPPQTVNAYYDPSRNNINFPAGILQPPFFNPKAPAAVNYGAVGFVMGHEITHGFDDQGAQFDGHGNLNNWWTPEDLKQFKAATSCISEHFSQYTVNDGLHVKGELVTGEATADLGGLTLAWRAFKASDAYENAETIAGFTPEQQFFLGAAHVWASNIRPEEARRRVTVDPHPPARYRVNGTVANMPQFQQAFDIPADSAMVNAQRCVIW